MLQINRAISKISIGNNEYLISQFIQNQHLFNMTIHKRVGENYEEIFPFEVSEEENKTIMRELRKATPVSAHEIEQFDRRIGVYRATALNAIREEFRKEMRIGHWGRVGGVNYLILKFRNKPFFDLQGVRLTSFGRIQQTHVVPPQFLDLIILDYLRDCKTIESFQHILVTNNYFVGLHSVRIGTQQGVSVTHISVEEGEFVCKRGYLVKRRLKSCEPLPISEITPELNELMKTQGIKALYDLLKKIS